ncbi:MAG: hypothetical protein R3A79_01280 [Nannocystaceae bacterium]
MTNRPILLAALASAALLACDVPLQDHYEVRGESRVPKGVAYDAAAQLFYATSLRGGEITLITALGREYSFYRSDDANLSLGAAVIDGDRRRLWVCAVDTRSEPSLPRSQLLGFDLDEGDLTRSVDLNAASGSFAPSECEALAVADDGVVYAADASSPTIYRYDPRDAEATVFAEDAAFGPDDVSGGLSGLAIHPSGDYLAAVRSDPPGVLVIPVAEPEALYPVQFPSRPMGRIGDPRLPAAGGAAFIGEDLYVTFPGAVQRLTFGGDDLRAALVHTTTAVPSGLSAVTKADGVAYAIDSDAYQVEHLGVRAEPPFAIVRVEPGLFAKDAAKDSDG